MAEPTKPTPTWQIVFLTTIFVTAIYSLLANPFEVGDEDKKSEASTEKQKIQAPISLPRNAFDATPDIVIGKWNTSAIDIDKSFVLPQKELWKNTENDKFHVISYLIKPSVNVMIEVDNQSQKAFSLSIIGAKSKEDDVLAVVTAMMLVGITVYGKGDNAAALGTACKNAEKDYKEITIEGFNIYCSYPMGVMMAGISVPK